MKNLKFSFILICSILLISCTTIENTEASTATSTYTKTPLPTATATLTPVPLFNLEGTLFFDYDGSGIQDEGEPPVVSFQVCEKSRNTCVTTDNDGRFVFESIASDGTHVSLGLINPNSNDPARKFRYANIWKNSVVIPPYEINGVSIPEQRLNDTDTFSIANTIDLVVGKESHIGLSQGYFTLPFDCDQNYILFNYFDLDSSSGVRNYLGDIRRFRADQFIGTEDGHGGIDFKIAVGEYLYAFAPGKLINGDNGRGSLWAEIYGSFGLNAHVGHISKYLAENQTKVYRGQIIALSGISGASWPHVHMQLKDGIDFFRDIQSPNSINYWTVDNNPVCIKVNK